MINVKDLSDYITNNSYSGIDAVVPLVNEYIEYNYVNMATHTINTVWVHDGKIDYIIMSIHDTKDDSKYIVACDINDAYKGKINNIQVHKIDLEQKGAIPGFHFMEEDYLITPTAIYHERKVINIEPSVYTKLLALNDGKTCFCDHYFSKFCSENFDLSYSIPLFERSLLFGNKNVYLVVFHGDGTTEIYNKTKYLYNPKNKLLASNIHEFLIRGDNNAI